MATTAADVQECMRAICHATGAIYWFAEDVPRGGQYPGGIAFADAVLEHLVHVSGEQIPQARKHFQSNDHHSCGGALATTASAAIRWYEAGSIESVYRIVKDGSEEAALDEILFVPSDAIFAGLRLADPWESLYSQEPTDRAALDECHLVLLARCGDGVAAELPSRRAWAS